MRMPMVGHSVTSCDVTSCDIDLGIEATYATTSAPSLSGCQLEETRDGFQTSLTGQRLQDLSHYGDKI